MNTVFLFGSTDLHVIPSEISDHIYQIMQLDREAKFIVGDNASIDSGFHKALSGIGARGCTTIYALDNVRNNKYDLNTRLFKSSLDVEKEQANIYDESGNLCSEIYNVKDTVGLVNSHEYYDFCSKQMVSDCTFGICYFDGENKVALRNIDRMKARNKPVYVYTASM